MKKFNGIITSGALAACVIFAGCSKSKNAGGSASSGGGDSDAPLLLKVKWQPGKRYSQHMSTDQTLHMTIPGVPKPIDQQTTFSEDYDLSVVKQLPDGGSQMEMDITGEKMESKTAGKTQISFDSTKDAKDDDKNPAAPLLRKMIGLQLKYEVDPSGKVNNVTGVDEFISGLTKSDAQSEQILRSLLNEGLIKQLAMRGFGLPEKPVKIGDHWPVDVEFPTGTVGTLKLQLKFTFRGWEPHEGKKCAVLDSVGEMNTENGTSTGTTKVAITKGKINGQSWYDPEMGMIVDSTSEQNMTLKINAQGKNIAGEMKQTIEIKQIDFADIAK